MRIRVQKERCSGCRICEMVCSLYHTGVINPERSAIRVYKDDLGKGLMEPRLCRRCDRMKCIQGEAVEEACESERFIWDPIRAERCVFGALSVFDGAAYHCDLCGGNPVCVRVCTTAALRIQKGKKGRSG